MNYEKFVPDAFSGVVSIVQDGEPVLERAYGWADAPNRRPNLLSTRFVTASAGKAFTACGVLKLIERGKLSFDATIGELLDFDLGRVDPGITVRQLLTHTSGMPDYFDESEGGEYSDIFRDFPCYRIRANRDFVPMFIDLPMLNEPGERFHYNNAGYVTLGLIIERVTGMAFDEYLKVEVFGPCSMDSTGYFEYDRLPENCANVYIRDDASGDYYTNIYSSTAKGTGDGGAFTCARDVRLFWEGLYGGKIIGRDMLDRMRAPQVSLDCYGLGLWLERIDGRHMPHFEGCEPGIGFISSYDHEARFLVTLISNRGDNVWKLNREILDARYGGVVPRFDYGE